MKDNNQKNTAIASAFPVATYNISDLAWTISFIIAAIILPALLAHTPQNQWITGTIVNAIIFLAVWRVGVVNAALMAALPSSIALLRGLLPAPMAILIPYIIISNLILIAVFYATKKRLLAGVIAASFAKFIFLLAISLFFVKTAGLLITMAQWPQLVTALAGGLIALGLMKILRIAE